MFLCSWMSSSWILYSVLKNLYYNIHIYIIFTFRNDFSFVGAFPEIRAVPAIPDEILQTEPRHSGRYFRRKYAHLGHFDLVESDVDELVLHLHGDHVFHQMRSQLHAQSLVDVGIAYFSLRLRTKLCHNAIFFVVLIIAIVGRATSLLDFLENIHQPKNGLADVQEIRRVVHKVSGLL